MSRRDGCASFGYPQKGLRRSSVLRVPESRQLALRVGRLSGLADGPKPYELFSLRVFRLGFLRTSGLVGKSCAISVRRLSFVLILGHWPHIGPVPAAAYSVLMFGTPGCVGV